MRIYSLVGIFVCLLLASQVMPGEKIAKYGKVSKEELAMKSLPEDPDANAVYLYEVGDLIMKKENNQHVIEGERRVRIKILTEEGKEQATREIFYFHEDKILDIKGHTVLPNGKKVKLKKDQIFDEQVNKNLRVKKFTLPGVEVGSVLEFKFKYYTQYIGGLEPWYFQNNEYTKVSRYSVTLLQYYEFNAFFTNIQEVEPMEEEVFHPKSREEVTKFTWELKDLPPIRKEPYMRSLNDYRAAIFFQISSYVSPYSRYEYIKDWESLVGEVWEHYQPQLSEDASLKQVVATQITADMTPAEKIQKLYEYVRDNVKTATDEFRYTAYPNKKTKDTLKDKIGNGGEKNMLLVNLYQLAGLNASPMMISTRYSGKVVIRQPRLNQFNHVLTYVKYGKKAYALDTYYKDCPFKLIPENDLVEVGLIIDEKGGGFVEVPKPRTVNMIHCKTTASLDDEGILTATITARYEDYRAMNVRKRIDEKGEKEYLESFLKNRFGEVVIDSFQFKGLGNIDESLHLEASYRIEDFAQVVGDKIYLSAPTLSHYKSNPFEREKRYYPVEFGFGLANTDEIRIELPEGYHVAELPNPVSANNKRQKLSFKNAWEVKDGTVKIQRQYLRQKEEYPHQVYDMLRTFFDRMVRADNAQLVLSNAPTETTDSQPE